jgi:peroxiredoxin Q/BCP
MSAPAGAAPRVGDRAPDVELPDDNGTIHRLADRRGHWTVLYFYPKDDTPGCTVEACQFRDLDADFGDADVEVWGVSRDSAASHRRFRDKFDLTVTLLSDPERTVIDAYGAWQQKSMLGKHYMGIVRSTFLIDPDGRVARAWPQVRADGHAAEVLEVIRSAQAGPPPAGRASAG